jgi:hypothetical protein
MGIEKYGQAEYRENNSHNGRNMGKQNIEKRTLRMGEIWASRI